MSRMEKPADWPWALAVFFMASATTIAFALSWHRDEYRAARDSECMQSCDLMGGEFAAANRYGCFCRDRDLGDVFMLSPEVDVE